MYDTQRAAKGGQGEREFQGGGKIGNVRKEGEGLRSGARWRGKRTEGSGEGGRVAGVSV